MAAISTRAHSLSRPPSHSGSLDSDNDTELDSIDADILDNDYSLPPPSQQSSHLHPQRSSSLDPGKQTRRYVRGFDRPSKRVQVEEKYHFDEFWDHIHRKKKRRPELPALDIDKNGEYDKERTMDRRNGLYNVRAYEIPSHRNSLIDYIRHGWRKNSYTNVHSGWSSPTDPAPSWMQVLSAPRIRRWILIFCVSMSLSWLYWRRYGQDAWIEHQTINNAVNGRMKSDLGYFGTNMLPEFVGMTQVKTLDAQFVPGLRDARRLIFVGDVHGCHEECE